MVRTETKQWILKGIIRQGKNEVPCKDWGPRVASHPLDSHDVFWHEVEAEHLLGEVLEDTEGRLPLGLVTMREALTLDLETSLDVLPSDPVDALLYEGLQGIVILGEFLLTLLQQLLARLQGSQAAFSGTHRGNVKTWKLVSDKGTGDRTVKGNITGLCGWMPLADICFDFNPNSVFVFSTVQVFSWKEEIGYSFEYNKSATLCNEFM